MGLGFVFNVAAPSLLESALSSSFYSTVKSEGLQLLPTSGAAAFERAEILAFAQNNNIEIAIRAQDPVSALVTRIGYYLRIAPKPEVDKAKSTFGLLFGLSGTLTRSDLDVAFIKDLTTKEYLLGDKAKALLDELNETILNKRLIFNEDARTVLASFQHGDHINALAEFGGPPYLTYAEYVKPVGSPGPATLFSADRGIVTLSESDVYDAFAVAAERRGVAPGYLWPWNKPKLDGATTESASGSTSVVSVSTATSMATVAASYWKQVDPDAVMPMMTLAIADLPAGELGEVTITAMGASGLPTAATITLSPNAAGAGWYVDPAPLNDSAFSTQVAPGVLSATAGSAAAGEYDLFTALLHEEGHLLGFDSALPGYDIHLETVGGAQLFVAPGLTAPVIAGADDLDASVYPEDLMSLTLEPGQRVLPSALDVQIINIVQEFSLAAKVPTVATPNGPTATLIGPVPTPAPG